MLQTAWSQPGYSWCLGTVDSTMTFSLEALLYCNELAGWLRSWDAYEATVGMAAVNGACTLAPLSAIIETIRRRFPEHNVLSEESGLNSGQSDQPTWIVDPLDGTTNFVHGLPFFAVAVALVRRGEPVLGVVQVPVHDTIYWGYSADSGRWAFKAEESGGAALGPAETAQVRDLIKQLEKENIGIFLISHDIHDVFDLADSVVADITQEQKSVPIPCQAESAVVVRRRPHRPFKCLQRAGPESAVRPV